jgi:N-acetyl-alpha-D-muramate 1-phosphate uridylyltransferase
VEALIFAAGLGTRLGELTRAVPKALVPVGGVPMLERVARRLIAAGVDRIVINTHHLHEQIVEFVESRAGFGIEVLFSQEPDRPLETGGGLKRAAPLFRGLAPIFLHNVDVLTDLPLDRIHQQHATRSALATLAVMKRKSSRYLLFDDEGLLGRVDKGRGLQLEVRPPRGKVSRLGFAGIHVIEPILFDLLEEEGVFSILDPYLRLSARGYRIEPYRADSWEWVDIGKPTQLDSANRRWEKPGAAVGAPPPRPRGAAGTKPEGGR